MAKVALNPYKGFGLTLAIVGGALTLYTYILQGLGPITAFWFGLLVVGVSILLTREEPVARREISSLIESSLASISILLEALNIRSRAVFKPEKDGVIYIYIGETDSGNTTGGGGGVFRTGRGIGIALRSPFNGVILETVNPVEEEGGTPTDVEGVLDSVAVDLLEMAESVECLKEPDKIVCRFLEAYAPTPGRVRESIGSVYAILTATAAAAVLRRPVSILFERFDGRSIVVGVGIQ